MPARTILISLLLLGVTSWTALATGTYVAIEHRLSAEQRHATGLDTLSEQQLALLNDLLRQDAEKARKSISSAEGAGRGGGSLVGFDDKPIKARLQGSLDGWQPGTVFELDNGQRWQVLKGSMKLRKTLQAPAIVLVPGLAGRWFLQVDEDLPKARVFRID